MRERDINRKLFNVGHYEVIAARFRESLTPFVVGNPSARMDSSRELMVLSDLALKLAHRFQLDNSEFDPVRFLARCSPDPTSFSIMWDGETSE